MRRNPDTLSISAPAKLNLFLHVTGRRDGYHLIESLVVFTQFGDRLEVCEDRQISLRVVGPFAGDCGPIEHNLVLRAARSLAALAPAPVGAALTLHKYLPAAAGLGGGSSDAAAALQLLLSLWKLRPGGTALSELALGLGADVPVCMQGRPAIAGGIGERLSAAPVLPPCYVLLVNPRLPLSTQAVFEKLDGRFSRAPKKFPAAIRTAGELVRLLGETQNDLQLPASELAPEILTVLDALRRQRGCLLSRMSGSGATCFGLFEDAAEMAAAAHTISRDHPQYWRGQTRF